MLLLQTTVTTAIVRHVPLALQGAADDAPAFADVIAGTASADIRTFPHHCRHSRSRWTRRRGGSSCCRASAMSRAKSETPAPLLQ